MANPNIMHSFSDFQWIFEQSFSKARHNATASSGNSNSIILKSIQPNSQIEFAMKDKENRLKCIQIVLSGVDAERIVRLNASQTI